MMQPTLVCFVCDKSGSMGIVRRPTIDGFNTFLRDQQEQAGACRMSLTMFDTSFDVRYVAEDVSRVAPLNDYLYQPGGGTALLDAVGSTIKGAEQWIANGHQQYKVIVAILTDGEENSSHEWHIRQPLIEGDDRDLAGLIQWKQTEGWEFVFMGAGGSGWLERTFGHVLAQDRFVQYTNDFAGTSSNYATLSAAVSTYRGTEGATFDTSGWDNKVQQAQDTLAEAKKKAKRNTPLP